MSRLSCPILLTLAVAFPTATLALGLGELHVDSALHQNLAAHIDLVDARHEDLVALRAVIGDEDTFQRYALDRPAFLNGTTVTVGQDAQGQPVLRLRSTQSFTEPAVTLLVDVHWPNGELIREYTVLLDPPESVIRAPASTAVLPRPTALATEGPTAYTTETPAALTTTAYAAAAPTVLPDAASVLADTASAVQTHVVPPTSSAAESVTSGPPKPSGRSYTVSRRDTLARVAAKAGARSRIARHTMMIAIYRANPAAFQSGPNSLHRGVVLRIPSAEELASISSADAEHEYRAQAAAWRASDPRALHTTKGRAVVAPPTPAPLETERAVLTSRVESLEKSLQQVRAELQQTQSQQQALARQAATPRPSAPATTAATSQTSEASTDDDAPRPLLSTLPFYRRAPIMTSITGLGLVLAVSALLKRRRRTDDDDDELAVEMSPPAGLQPAATTPTESAATTPNSSAAAAPTESAITAALLADSATGQTTTALPQVPLGATTAVLTQRIEAPGDTVEQKFSFYNPESHTDTTHVVVSSELNLPAPTFVERRKHPTAVLQQAIEREPHRSDLHLKLLELYYAAAAENRRAFLDAARQITQNNKLISTEDLARISEMGHKIAPDDELFSSDLDDQAVA